MLSPLDPTSKNMSLKAACPPSTSKNSEIQVQFDMLLFVAGKERK